MYPEEIVYEGQLHGNSDLSPEEKEDYALLVKGLRTFQAGLFHNLVRSFPSYGTYFHGAYYVNVLMGENGAVYVEFGDHSDYSIEIDLSFSKDPRNKLALVQTRYDFSKAGVLSPKNELFTVSRRNMLIGVTGEFSNIVGEMCIGTTFTTQGGVDYLGRQGNSLSHTYELVQVYQDKPDGYGVTYSQVGYRWL